MIEEKEVDEEYSIKLTEKIAYKNSHASLLSPIKLNIADRISETSSKLSGNDFMIYMNGIMPIKEENQDIEE